MAEGRADVQFMDRINIFSHLWAAGGHQVTRSKRNMLRMLAEMRNELCRVHRLDQGELFDYAMRRVFQEDLLGEPPVPSDSSTAERRAIRMTKRMIRIDLQELPDSEPELAKGCPGWWLVSEMKEIAAQVGIEHEMEKWEEAQ